MTVTLELDPVLEVRLRETAAQAGLGVEEYLVSLVQGEGPERAPQTGGHEKQSLPPEPERTLPYNREETGWNEPTPKTPAEIVAYWERMGVHKTAPDGPDSPELVRQWRKQRAEASARKMGLSAAGGDPAADDVSA